jgi:hypothetical protein
MRRYVTLLGFVCMLSLGALTLTGCENRERVLEVDTPSGSLEVDRVEERPRDIDVRTDRVEERPRDTDIQIDIRREDNTNP